MSQPTYVVSWKPTQCVIKNIKALWNSALRLLISGKCSLTIAFQWTKQTVTRYRSETSPIFFDLLCCQLLRIFWPFFGVFISESSRWLIRRGVTSGNIITSWLLRYLSLSTFIPNKQGAITIQTKIFSWRINHLICVSPLLEFHYWLTNQRDCQPTKQVLWAAIGQPAPLAFRRCALSWIHESKWNVEKSRQYCWHGGHWCRWINDELELSNDK